MKRNYGPLIVGLVFIGVGIGYVGNVAGWWSGFTLFFPGWWTLFIIVPCLTAIVNSGMNLPSLIGVLIGVFLLVTQQEKLAFLWSLLIPGALIIIGLYIIFKSKLLKYRRVVRAEDGGAYYIPIYNCYVNSRDVKFGHFELHGAEVSTTFGSLNLDLSDAIITKDVVIDVTNIFAGATITLPPYVKMQPTVNPLFGKITDRTAPDPAAVHTVYINANCLFAGTEVKTAIWQ
jgi:Predicted membrane protein (DUF2154).